jgi:predicted transcriptional regulator
MTQAKSTTLTVRLNDRTKGVLEQIAAHEKRTKSFVASQAIANFIDIYEAQVRSIERAIASADAGQFVAHEDVKAWVESWGTENELPRPSTKK